MTNQSRPPPAITYKGLLQAYLSLHIDASLSLVSQHIARPSYQHHSRKRSTSSLASWLHFSRRRSSYFPWPLYSWACCQRISHWRLTLQKDAFLGLCPAHPSAPTLPFINVSADGILFMNIVKNSFQGLRLFPLSFRSFFALGRGGRLPGHASSVGFAQTSIYISVGVCITSYGLAACEH